MNLNPDKYCNFDCVYCQVDRTVPGGPVLRKADLPQLPPNWMKWSSWPSAEPAIRRHTISTTPPSTAGSNDIALSGDGEPTVLADF